MWGPGPDSPGLGCGDGGTGSNILYQGLDVEGQPPETPPETKQTYGSWCPVAVLGFCVAAALSCAMLFYQPHRRPLQASISATEELVAYPNVGPANANDLWGIHDLILLGFRAPFMQPGSAGLQEVQASVGELILMLPQVHPHPPCRQLMTTVVAGTAPGHDRVIQAAQAAWDCLPAKYTPASFSVAFTPDGLDAGSELAGDARDPAVLDPTVLGACATTQWHRTCSYWVSLHAMAYRADGLRMGPRFLYNVINILAGGATMCGGCTLHLRALHKPVLSSYVVNDLGELD